MGQRGLKEDQKVKKSMSEAQRKKEKERQAEGGREEMWRAAVETGETPPPAL